LPSPFGCHRSLAPVLLVLAVAGSGCARGSGSGIGLSTPSPFGLAPGAARTASVPRDSTPAAGRTGAASRRKASPPVKRSSPAPSPAKLRAPAKAATRTTDKPPIRPPRPLVDSTALEFAVTARLAHEPLTRAIARRTRNPELAERAAWAVTREAGRLRISPSLLAAVLLVENRQLDSAAVSSQGAVGLMQVMPIHAGSYGCQSDDLRSVDGNICHGARILHLYLVRSRSVTVALRRYNGCVRGANTPQCHRYPARVLRTAARLRRDLLASAAPADPPRTHPKS
jgi:soluble lytic murein transglycosylase-like protein